MPAPATGAGAPDGGGPLAVGAAEAREIAEALTVILVGVGLARGRAGSSERLAHPLELALTAARRLRAILLESIDRSRATTTQRPSSGR